MAMAVMVVKELGEWPGLKLKMTFPHGIFIGCEGMPFCYSFSLRKLQSYFDANELNSSRDREPVPAYQS